ncbi:MAG TPA: hypothetical protein DGT21_21345 [Armatimonadetes bacterium]|jgi:hypothetical protein|nr:hypothetical protein [Armatimonadota bacterium]
MGKGSLMQLLAAVCIGTIVAAFLVGCGGGNNNAGPINPTGTVSGRIMHFDTDQGLGGVTVTVGGRTAVSDNSGNFTVTNVPVGNNQVVTITPPEWLALPGGVQITVNVYQGQNTALADPIRLVNSGEYPPDPPLQ